MLRASSLIRCTLLALVVTGCGAKRAVSHPATRHARTAEPPSTSPLWVADRYYVASSFPEERAHATGEFAQRFATQPTLGSLLAPSATVALRSVLEHGDSAIVAATVTEPDRNRTAEWYSYLVRDGGTWKMYAIRTVHFEPEYYALLDSLATGKRASAYQGQRESMVLATASDSVLRAFVTSHSAQLDSLADAYRAAPHAPATIAVSDPATVADQGASVHRLLGATNASAIFRDAANPGCTFVRINGEGSRQVGAFRADAGCRVPAMSAARLIYVEHVRGDWYLYRAL